MAVKYSVQSNDVKLYLGHQGENLARELEFDLSEWMSEYGEGTAQLLHQRPGEDSLYPAKVEMTGDKLLWRLTNADTAISGFGFCELQYLINDVVVKSKIYKTRTVPSLDGDMTETPAPERGWMKDVFDAEANAKESADKAKEAAEQAKKAAEQAEESCDIFVAEYGKTTWDELKTAYNAGKYIVVNKNGAVYGLYRADSSTIEFRQPEPNTSPYCSCTSANKWTNGYYSSGVSIHASNHATGGRDPITPESIGAISAVGESIADPEINIDDLTLTKCYLCGSTVIKKGLQGDLPWTSSFLLKVEDFRGDGGRAIQTAYKNSSTKPERKWRLWTGDVWSPWQIG